MGFQRRHSPGLLGFVVAMSLSGAVLAEAPATGSSPSAPPTATSAPQIRYYALPSGCSACSKIGAAIKELEAKYNGKVTFRYIEINEDKIQQEADSFELGGHGLVGLSATGEPRVKIPGHGFGKAKIEASAEALLATNDGKAQVGQ